MAKLVTVFIKRENPHFDEPLTMTLREAKRLKKEFKGTEIEIEICDEVLCVFKVKEVIDEYWRCFRGVETERWGIL